jgi:predicted regulator of Ras-like GTPase activity (Roadblock/LC7/MglB family)
MYKLARRENLIWFVVTFVVCIAISVFLPSLFPQQRFEIPTFALFPAEMALVMILSVFFYENASPNEQFRLAFTMLAITMFTGAATNVAFQCSQGMPDSTLLINWVQLICMNVSGLAATLALYQTQATEMQTLAAPRASGQRQDVTLEMPVAEDGEELPERSHVDTGKSAQEILDELDVSRINRLEKQISAQKTTQESSIESLFAEESQAAKIQSGSFEAAPPEPAALPGPRAASLDDLLSGGEIPVFTPQPVAPKEEAAATASTADDAFSSLLDGTSDASAEVATAKDAVASPNTAKQELVSAIEEIFMGIDMTADASATAHVVAAIDETFSGIDMTATAPVEIPSAEAKASQVFALNQTEEVVAPAHENLVDTLIDSPSPKTVTEATIDLSAAGLFNEQNLGGDLDNIFSDLAPGVSNDDFTPEKLASLKSPAPVVEPPAAETTNKLFDDGLGGDIDSIFDNLAPDANKEVADLLNLTKTAASADATPAPKSPDVDNTAQAPATPAPATATPAPAPAPAAEAPQPAPAGQSSSGGKEVKEFGRLSAAATAKAELPAPGTLKTIGQMLLDTSAVENIIKRSENRADDAKASALTTAKVVSVSRGADIQQMLDKVASFEGIDGSLVIGKDGLLIGATESLGMMRDVLGVLALGIHSTTGLGTKKVDLGELRQSILRTGEKLTILTEVGIGVLACFSDHFKLETIDGMLDHIRKVISESQASGGTSLPIETLSGGMLAAASEPAPAAAPAPAPAPAPEPVAPPPAPAPVEDVAVPISEAKGGLFNVNDDDIGGLFDEILTDSTVHNDAIKGGGGAAAPATPAPAAPPATPPAQATPAAASSAEKPLLQVDDQMMSDIFDNLLDGAGSADPSMDFSPPGGVTSGAAPSMPPSAPAAPAPAASAPAQPAAQTPAAAAKPAEPAPAEAPKPQPAAPAASVPAAAQPTAASGQQIKEFGRLSISAANKAGTEDGAIKAIGRQLIDVQAVENIIKAGEKREKMGSGLTTARVISAARGEGIKALLTKIDGCPGVAGSLIVGNDGLVIASTLTGGLDKDLLGALCTAMHSHSELALKKLDMGKLKQIIFHTPQKMTILTAVAVGVLAVFVDGHDATGIDNLLGAIDQTVRG